MEEKIAITYDETRKLYSDRSCFKYGEKDGGKFLDAGLYGNVSVICLKDEIPSEECRNVVKAIDIDNADEKEIESEIQFVKICSKLQISPRYVRDFRCKVNIDDEEKDFQFIITERYDVTLAQLTEKKMSKEMVLSVKKQLLELMSKCMNFGFLHGDIYSDNIELENRINEGNLMFNYNSDKSEVIDCKFIDLDGAKINIDSKKVKDQWCGLWDTLRKLYPEFENYRLSVDEIKICFS